MDITTLAAWGEFIGGIAVVVSLQGGRTRPRRRSGAGRTVRVARPRSDSLTDRAR